MGLVPHWGDRVASRARRPAAASSPSDRSGELPPAIIVGGSGACGLGIVRSLARARVPSILLDTSRASPAMRTRLGRTRAVSALQGPALVDDLVRLGQTLPERPVLFLTSDEGVLTVSEYRANLEQRYRIRLPAHETLTSLMLKTRFQSMAERYGFPVPRSIEMTRSSGFEALGCLSFPCIIKPALKDAGYVGSGLDRAYRVGSRRDAETVLQRLLAVVPSLVVQEWIEGPDSEIYFCLQYRSHAGATVASFTGRKLGIWPPDVGITASCTAAPEARRVLHPMTEAFFDRVGFIGMGSMEYKRDVRTGRYLMIEPTVGRADWQEEVATLHGVNIPVAAYSCELGRRVPEAEEGPPVIWRDFWLDRQSRGWRSPHGSVPNWPTYDAYWRLDDPMPALYRGLNGATRVVGSVRSRIRFSPRFRRAPPANATLG